MALRSGYKGIKKLASGLKWKRPGILAADDTALAKVFFPRSEQAVLGAENLFNPAYATSGASDYYVPVYVGDNITVTLSSNMPKNNNDGANLFLLAGNVQSGISTATNGVWIDNPRTVTAVSGYITICSRNSTGVNPVDYNHMLNLGTVARPFVPYAMTNKELTEVNNREEMVLNLTGISTIKGMIEAVFTNAIPLLTSDYQKASGVIRVQGVDAMGFFVHRVSSTLFRALLYKESTIYTALSSSGTVTAYSYTGTVLS